MGKTYKRGNKWGITYIDPDGEQVRKIISPYKEHAEMALRKVEMEIFQNFHLGKKYVPRLLFEDFAKEYLVTHIQVENERNVKKQQNILNGLVKHFGKFYLDQISTIKIKSFIGERSKNRKPSTVNKDLNMLKSLFNRAIEWDRFDGKNPARGIKRLKERNERVRYLCDDEREALINQCNGVTKAVVITALNTGLRFSEIINLKRHRCNNSNFVDFESKTIYVHTSLAKTSKSRYIPLIPCVEEALKAVPKHTGTDYFFWNPDTKKPIGSIKRSFGNAVKKAGIEDFRFHDCRHDFASRFLLKGGDIYVLQNILGHSSIKLTERYAHLRPDQLRQEMAKLYLQDKEDEYHTPSNKSFKYDDLSTQGFGIKAS